MGSAWLPASASASRNSRHMVAARQSYWLLPTVPSIRRRLLGAIASRPSVRPTLFLWTSCPAALSMRTHEGIGFSRRVAGVDRILDPRPEFLLHPVSGNQHFDARQPQVTFFEIADGVASLQSPNGVEAEVGQKPGVRDDDLGPPASLVWHGATINGASARYMLHECRC